MQVQPAVLYISSNRGLPFCLEGHDYLNHWSSSFHAIQILVSVKKLSYGSLPADLFELPEGVSDRLFVHRYFMLKTSLITLFKVFSGETSRTGKRLFAFNDSRQSVQTERVLLQPSVSLLSPFKSAGLDLF